MSFNQRTPNNNSSPSSSNEHVDFMNRTDLTTDNLLEMSINSTKTFVGLERKVGVLSGISLIVGTMIGSGIFASPRYVMVYSDSVGMTLLVWCLCGVLSLAGALCYAELGTMIPLSGAEFIYLYKGLGELPGFLYAWTSTIILKPAQLAAVCLAFGAYVIEPFFPGCSERGDLAPVVKLLSALAIGLTVSTLTCFAAADQDMRTVNYCSNLCYRACLPHEMQQLKLSTSDSLAFETNEFYAPQVEE